MGLFCLISFFFSLITLAVPLPSLPAFISFADHSFLDSSTPPLLLFLLLLLYPSFSSFFSSYPSTYSFPYNSCGSSLALPSLTSSPASSIDPPSVPHSPTNYPSIPPRLASLVPLLHALPSLFLLPSAVSHFALPLLTSLSSTDLPSIPDSSIDSHSTPHSPFSSCSFLSFSSFIYDLLSFCFIALPSSTLVLLDYLL